MNQYRKKQLKRIICRTPFMLRFMAYHTRYLPKIFMYHRFTHQEYETGLCVSATNFEWQLQQLKGYWNVISLAEYAKLRCQNIKVKPYTVIITIDDGYRDFYDVAYPLLHKYQFPATFFATTSFVDGTNWLWHDRLYFALNKTNVTDAEISLGNERIRIQTSSKSLKSATWQILSNNCIDITDKKKWQFIKLVEEKLRVKAPPTPPIEFAAASWDHLKEMSDNGIEIGGHTVTHPVLSQTDLTQLQSEISDPEKIIRSKIGKPVKTFCYPNGRDEDITDRVLKITAEVGYLGAVQGTGVDFSNLYRLPRMGISNDRLDFIWKLSGFEQFSMK